MASDGTKKELTFTKPLESVRSWPGVLPLKMLIFTTSHEMPLVLRIQCPPPLIGTIPETIQIAAILGKQRSYQITIPAETEVFGRCGPALDAYDEIVLRVPSKSQNDFVIHMKDWSGQFQKP